MKFAGLVLVLLVMAAVTHGRPPVRHFDVHVHELIYVSYLFHGKAASQRDYGFSPTPHNLGDNQACIRYSQLHVCLSYGRIDL